MSKESIFDKDAEIIYRHTKGRPDRIDISGRGIVLIWGVVEIAVSILLKITDGDEEECGALADKLTDYMKYKLKEELKKRKESRGEADERYRTEGTDNP